MAKRKKVPLETIVELLHLTMCSFGALEKAVLESAESGKSITNRQLNRLRRQAKSDLKEKFDALETSILLLPKSQL